MDENMFGALLNVSPNQILWHRLILAFKCYAFLNWVKLPDISWFQKIFLHLVHILKGINSAGLPGADEAPICHDEVHSSYAIEDQPSHAVDHVSSADVDSVSDTDEDLMPNSDEDQILPAEENLPHVNEMVIPPVSAQAHQPNGAPVDHLNEVNAQSPSNGVRPPFLYNLWYPHHGLRPQSLSNGLRPQNVSNGLRPQNVSNGLRPQNLFNGLRPQNVSNGLRPQNLNGVRPQNLSNGFLILNLNNGLRLQNILNALRPQNLNNGFRPQNLNNGLRPQNLNNGFRPQNLNNGFRPQNLYNGLRPQNPLNGLRPQIQYNGVRPQNVPFEDPLNLFGIHALNEPLPLEHPIDANLPQANGLNANPMAAPFLLDGGLDFYEEDNDDDGMHNYHLNNGGYVHHPHNGEVMEVINPHVQHQDNEAVVQQNDPDVQNQDNESVVQQNDPDVQNQDNEAVVQQNDPDVQNQDNEEGINPHVQHQPSEVVEQHINPHVRHQANEEGINPLVHLQANEVVEQHINPHIQHQANNVMHIDSHNAFEALFEVSNYTFLWVLGIFLGSDGDLLSKCWALTFYLVLLLMQHKSVNEVFLYFFCLGACFLCDEMELIIDLFLLREYLCTIMRSSSPLAFLTVSMVSWYILPVDLLILVFYCVYILIIPRVPLRFYLTFSYFLASFQILIHHDTIFLSDDSLLEVLYEICGKTFRPLTKLCSINGLRFLREQWTNLNF